jgi:hypothetical protein
MKKHVTIMLSIIMALTSSCTKDVVKDIGTSKSDEITKNKTSVVNTVNPGGSTIVTFENGRYIAHFGFDDFDLGGVTFPSGPYVDGQAVSSVGIGAGPYFSVSFTALVGQAKTNYYKDLSDFNKAWYNFINSVINPDTHMTYDRPTWDIIQNSYNDIAIFKGIVVRDHSFPSTVVIKDASFVPVSFIPAPAKPLLLGYVKDAATQQYYDVAGHDGVVTEVYKVVGTQETPVANFAGTYKTYPNHPTSINARIYTGAGTYFEYSGNIIVEF